MMMQNRDIFPPYYNGEELFELMCIRAGKDGRNEVLFGGCMEKAIELGRPFIVGNRFPCIFLECPLKGDPFLDLTFLYGQLPEGVSIKSRYAEKSIDVLSCYSDMRAHYPDINFGFEIDTSREDPGMAAVHFEPRNHTELVAPFCASIGEAKSGELYLETAAKLADSFPLSYFGMFRGRSDSPLRVCGYLGKGERESIIKDRDHLLRLFDTVGFTAYDDAMAGIIVNIIKLAPRDVDYQLDIYPDRKAGEIFSLDIRLPEKTAEDIKRSFKTGTSAAFLSRLCDLGIVDGRIDMLCDMATSKVFPGTNKAGKPAGCVMLIRPEWIKIRWNGAILQNAKCYSSMKGGYISYEQ